MKAKIAVTLITIIAGIFVFTRTKNIPPSDLRDAVAELKSPDFNTDVLSLENNSENLPIPLPAIAKKETSSSVNSDYSQSVTDERVGKSIHGQDDMREYYKTPDDKKQLAASVVSLWNDGGVFDVGNGTFRLAVYPLNDRLGQYLCPQERFSNHFGGAVCSGALIGDDIVLTAGHCIKNEERCGNTVIVFGYKLENPAMPLTYTYEGAGYGIFSVKREEVYVCKKVISRKFTRNWITGPEDYALIQLDRKVEGHNPLPVNFSRPKRGSSIFTIGHPLGMPVIISDNAVIIDDSPENYFTSDLDVLAGNSGSPVFDTYTKSIIGILARAYSLKESPEGCNVIVRVGQNVDDTHINRLPPSLPEIIR